jgi:flavin-dependent dehydrogenase
LNTSNTYDLAVIGGGLAGLSLAIQSARAGYNTILFEKEKYPFHRVCGEYISLESWNFLQELGVPLSDLHLPIIQRVIVSAPNGKHIEQPLPLGGFGISRYFLDHLLATIAKREGVTVCEETRVLDVAFSRDRFNIQTSAGEYSSRSAAGAFGKRSNLDIKWKRSFVQRRPNKLNHYIAVKYHIQFPFPPDLIALHNFENGYCGISNVEHNACCLCYLTTADNLKMYKGDIAKIEANILMKNPFLADIFTKAKFIFDEPVTISQVSFNSKSQVENHVLMVGDAAGMITPLCGNGMSMALHGSKLAFHEITGFLRGEYSRFEMETQYSQQWEKLFGRRLQAGRLLQRFFGGAWQSNLFIQALKPFPGFASFLIKQTHGEPF